MSVQPRVVLIGSRSTISVAGFHLLRELGCDLPLVITGDEDPGTDDWRLSLAKAARDAGHRDGASLCVVRDPHTPDMLERIRKSAPDVILSLQWRRILKPSLLQIPSRHVVNLHNAPLPLLRGCDPFSWAIHDGLQMMGVSLHIVPDAGVDSGPVVAQRLWPITKTSTAWSLYQESLPQAEQLLRDALPGILEGTATPEPQDPRYSTYHPIGQFAFGELEARWTFPAIVVSGALRSRIFPPFQLPFFTIRGTKVEILACEASYGRGKPGTVLNCDPLLIATRPGAIQIHRVRVQGVEHSGPDFARDFKLKPGDMSA